MQIFHLFALVSEGKLEPDRRNAFQESEAMGHPVSLHSLRVREGIDVPRIAGLAGAFNEKVLQCIKSQAAFDAEVIPSDVEVIVQALTFPGKVGAWNIDPGPTFIYILQQGPGLIMRFYHRAEAHEVDVDPVSTIGVFKVKIAVAVEHTISIHMLSIDSSGDMDALAIGYNVFGVIEVELDGLCPFLVQVKTDTVVILRDGDFHGLIIECIEVIGVMGLRMMQDEVVPIAHLEVNVTSAVSVQVITPLEIHAFEPARVLVIGGGLGICRNQG